VYVAANLICLLAAVYPAWHASRLLPAESIRYE
jgi:ABC-type lipoprotein release transport system permease subunit